MGVTIISEFRELETELNSENENLVEMASNK